VTDSHDPPTWDTAIVTLTIGTPAADLSITLTNAPDPATVGTDVTYTITNGGPAPATGVVVTDHLPAAAAFVSAAASPGSCSGTAPVTCDLGTLASGASATVTIVATATTSGTLTNTASVAGVESDPDTANNAATAETGVVAANCLGTGSGGISGRLRTSTGAAIADVTVALEGPGGCTDSATSTSAGRYQFPTLATGTYTMTPSKAGCTFTPASRTVSTSGPDRRANFTGSCPRDRPSRLPLARIAVLEDHGPSCLARRSCSHPRSSRRPPPRAPSAREDGDR
jgi:uncharacterized repeat protein (TIGR01451 family)